MAHTSRKVKQDYGSDPVSVRETDQYRAEYVHAFVQKWDSLIDWDARIQSEGSFFIDKLKERGCRQVLDVATGTGFHSVRLLEAGFEVVSADGSAEMLSKAFANARNRGHILRTVQADWRWLNRDVHQKFDAIICLGNSFTHLFDENDRRKALAEFYAALRHNGILILDQRNYDALLDDGFSSTHAYYYCGTDVSVKPVHVDDGLARFKYGFSDGESFFLNMYPLRKDYTKRLMREVGFQHIETFGDFQQTYRDSEPDFFIHIAEKAYQLPKKVSRKKTIESAAVDKARDYYNSEDADNFYSQVWGGEDIHIGLYQNSSESIAQASQRTVQVMAGHLPKLDATTVLLDLGSGYCGSARYLAKNYGAHVKAINLSDVENQRARTLNAAAGLSEKIEVIDGSFERLPFDTSGNDTGFDVVWSQDAILHSEKREQVMAEAFRVLKPGGHFIFTDPMQADNCPEGVLQPIYDRIHLSSLGSPAFYKQAAVKAGFNVVQFDDLTHQLINHYQRVLDETNKKTGELTGEIDPAYIERMKTGLGYWVDGGKKGYLAWGIFLFQKPESGH
ncbi:MAG: methyltransferase domain-containing protein [Nitrosomonas sp.]|nr:methyltransferase domain-containing protein [Nitrosomonas sp.]